MPLANQKSVVIIAPVRSAHPLHLPVAQSDIRFVAFLIVATILVWISIIIPNTAANVLKNVKTIITVIMENVRVVRAIYMHVAHRVVTDINVAIIPVPICNSIRSTVVNAATLAKLDKPAAIAYVSICSLIDSTVARVEMYVH
jgi:hypothetical protein